MVVPDLPEGLLGDGREYLDQLTTLGLHPEGFMWVHDVQRREFVIQLIWSGLDAHGPLSLSKLLFKAYRESKLTQKIDPMIIEARSPNDIVGEGLLRYAARGRKIGQRFMWMTKRPALSPIPPTDEEVVFQWNTDWVYTVQVKARSAKIVDRDWQRFRDSVEAVAA